MHRHLCEYECETTVSSFPFHGLLYFHVLWEYRESHPKPQLLKEQFLLGKWNTHKKKCQNQAHSYVLHWNEHIIWASVFDSVASYKCQSRNWHSSFIMWIQESITWPSIHVGLHLCGLQSEAVLWESDELSTAQECLNSAPYELHSKFPIMNLLSMNLQNHFQNFWHHPPPQPSEELNSHCVKEYPLLFILKQSSSNFKCLWYYYCRIW